MFGALSAAEVWVRLDVIIKQITHSSVLLPALYCKSVAPQWFSPKGLWDKSEGKWWKVTSTCLQVQFWDTLSTFYATSAATTTFLRKVSFFFYSSLRFQSQNMRSFHKTRCPRYQLSYFRRPIAPRLIDTDGKWTFPSVYGPLKDLYITHIHPFMHRWQECKEPTCSSGESKGSVPCSRIQPEELRNRTTNLSDYWMSRSTLWALTTQSKTQAQVSFKLLGEAGFGRISMLNGSTWSTGRHM